MYIPDPCELMEMRQERLMHDWDAAQKDVPPGSFRCPECRKISTGEPIAIDGRPDAPVVCYECLPESVKAAYDQWEKSFGSSR